MTRAVRTRRSTSSSNKRWTPPLVEQFLQAKTGQEFEEMKSKPGDNPQDKIDFQKLPTHILTHAFALYAM
jgi:hypothetical protein